MAQAALLQVNGIPGLVQPPEPPIMAVPSKRKRDTADDPAPSPDATLDVKKHTASTPSAHSDQDTALLRDYLHIVQTHDHVNILKRPLPDALSSTAEPNSKRQKSEDPRPTSIADKAAANGYGSLDLLVADILVAVKDYIREAQLSSVPNPDGVAMADKFKQYALDLLRRELNYPNICPDVDGKRDANTPRADVVGSDSGGLVLTAWANAPRQRQLFSSLQKSADGETKTIDESLLPTPITASRIVPIMTTSAENSTPTLGELFPAPRNLPPLQPPKAPKNTTREKELGFYHPELSKRPTHRVNNYPVQPINPGQWLDYSNATPPSHTKTKQRERAQSLAGVKPSSFELEMSEMEALFRGAFSSFAPSKDDSGAVVPATTLGQMWWRRVGEGQFQRMMTDGDEEQPDREVSGLPDLDMEFMEQVVNEFDESAVDPSLEAALAPSKTKEEMDTEDILQEISDLLQTLDSHQRNRNLTLPTTQNRHAADPANGDMLKNPSTSQPTEDEVRTYEMLKNQLKLIISTLPPHLVARVHGERGGDLLVSKRIEIRSDVYKGIMDEDENVVRAKQHQVAPMSAVANPAPHPTPHRTPSAPVQTPGPYGPPQYATTPYVQQGRPPMPNQPPYYAGGAPTPVRPQGPPNVPRPGPIAQPAHQPPQRPPPVGQPYRPTIGGYPGGGYPAQLAKAQTPYGHSGLPQYHSASPMQPRMSQQHPAYSGVPAGASPHSRYAAPYPPGYHQPPQQTHGSYHGYPNGTPVGQRPMPQPGYGSPGPQPATPHRPGYAPGPPQPSPMHPNQIQQQRAYPPANAHAAPQQTPAHLRSGYQTVMSESQHQTVVERAQAAARQNAHEKALGFTPGPGTPGPPSGMPQHGVQGLAGIGLSGQMNVNRMAAARASMSSPSPHMHPGHPVPAPGQQAPNGVPPQHHAPQHAPQHHPQQMYSQAHLPAPSPSPAPSHSSIPPQAPPTPQPR